MRRYLALAMVGGAVMFVVALWALPSTAMGGPPLDGRELFVDTHKCNMCHSVKAAGIEAKTKSENMIGPDLSGRIEYDFAEIAAFVRKEADLDGDSHRKPFKGTDEELRAIVDWLGSLEAK